MASYPGSVWAPTTKNNGDTIQASHIDDAQNEIIAIEDGIRNATAPLNSSNSTVANLSVVGNSTFAGNVNIAGTLTFTANRAAVSLTNSAIQNVNSASLTALNFDTEASDPINMHSTAVNSSRIAFTVAGTYLIGANVLWSNNSTAGTFRQLGLVLNDVTTLPTVQAAPNPNTGLSVGQSIVSLYTPASTTEWVTVTVQQNSGSTMSISSGTAGVRFWATLVGV